VLSFGATVQAFDAAATATSPPPIADAAGKNPPFPTILGVGCGSFVNTVACSDVAVYKYSSTGSASVCHPISPGRPRKGAPLLTRRDGPCDCCNTNSADFPGHIRCRATGLRRAPASPNDSDVPGAGDFFAWHSMLPGSSRRARF